MTNSNGNQLSTDLRAALQNGPGIFKRINAYRDNGTHADEWLILLRPLLVISAAFTLSFGCALHYNLALPYAGNYGAAIFAGVFTLFIELSKLIAGKWVVRQTLFGMFQQGFSSMGLILCGALIAGGAFFWSYYNSTTGVRYLSEYLGEIHVERKIVKPDTEQLDQRLNKTANLTTNGLNIRWKGNTTREGQRIAQKAATAMAEQEKQKTILIQQAAEEQQRADNHRGQFIGKVGVILSFLGGKMEWFQLAIILAMVFAEKTLWHRMVKSGNTGAPPYRPNLNPATAHPIGFNTDQNGNVRMATPRAVNGLPETPANGLYHTVPQANTGAAVIGTDEALKHLKTRLGRDVANLKNENGNVRTVANRMRTTIIELARLMQQPGFDPDTILATELYIYLQSTVFPALEQQGRAFQTSKEVLEDLYLFIDVQEYELRTKEQPHA